MEVTIFCAFFYMNIFGIEQKMLKKMMEQNDKPQLKDFIEGVRKKNIKFYAGKSSMKVMGFQEKELLPELEIIEVDKYLQEATKSDIQLFI